MNDSLIKKVREQIKEEGFPLELRIANFLNKNSYYIAHSLYYIDEDEQKSREVDLRALKSYGFESKDKSDRNHKLWVRNCFFIECKKSKDPWIFLCSPKNVYDVDYDKIPHLPKTDFLEDYNLKILENKHPFSNYDLVGRSYFTLGKKNRNIFKAITTSVKATLYSMSQDFPVGSTSICYYYPIIILEGRLFQGFLKNNEIEIKEVSSILLSFLYESNKSENSKFAIPIIVENEVPEFFKKMDKVLQFLGNLAENNPSKLFRILR